MIIGARHSRSCLRPGFRRSSSCRKPFRVQGKYQVQWEPRPKPSLPLAASNCSKATTIKGLCISLQSVTAGSLVRLNPILTYPSKPDKTACPKTPGDHQQTNGHRRFFINTYGGLASVPSFNCKGKVIHHPNLRKLKHIIPKFEGLTFYDYPSLSSVFVYSSTSCC